MRFKFTIDVEVSRIEGKFASRAEISEYITDMLESADYGQIDGVGADGMSSYEIVEWSVNEEDKS